MASVDVVGAATQAIEMASPYYPKIISAGEGSKFMGPHDIVGMTFLIAQNTMLAFTFFFMMERSSVPARWQTSMTVAGMVTLVAFFNYQYMRETWIGIQTSPTTYRYTDWLVTVPLLILEFYTVLKATCRVGEQVFWRLLIASLVMLIGGFLGESMLIASGIGFIVGMAGWLFILYEVFAGESSQISASSNSASGIKCFNTLRFLVAIGWSIYPIGYLLRGSSYEGVNIAYNLADLLNKGFFGLAVWAAAKAEEK